MTTNANINKLIENLSSASPIIREDSATTLGELNNQTAVAALVEKLNDPSHWVRSRAAEALGRIGDIAAIGGLQNCLVDKDFNVSRVPIIALGEIGATSAIPRIVRSLSDKRLRVVRAASDTFARLGANDSVRELKKLEKHQDEAVKRPAKEAIFRLQNHLTPSIIPEPIGVTLQVAVFGVEPFRLNTWSAMQIRLQNTGRCIARTVQASINGDWGGEAASLGDLESGESQTGLLRIRPQSAGEEVPITLRFEYSLANGMKKELPFPHLVPVQNEPAQVFHSGGDMVFSGGVNAPSRMAIAQTESPQPTGTLGPLTDDNIGVAWLGLFQKFEEGKQSLRIQELKAKMNLKRERIDALSKASVEVLITISDEPQSRPIEMLNEMRVLQGFSPQQLLAKGAVDNPEFASAYGDLLLAVAVNDQTEQYERLIGEMKSSASDAHEDYDRNLEILLEMFRKSLDSIRDTAIAAAK